MLVVAGDERHVWPASLEGHGEPISDRRPDATAHGMADDDRGAVGARLVAGPVVGAVIDDDRLEPAVARNLVQDSADLAGLVQCWDDDGHQRREG